MDISIITVSYNTADIIDRCITSVFSQTGVSCEHILVDNNSQDNSLDVIRSFEPRVTCIANPTNAGFGRANNLAAKQASGKYLCLLNPDAQLIAPDSLKKLMDYLDAHPECGLVGTSSQDESGKANSRPRLSYPKEGRSKQHFTHLPGPIAWVTGASMLIRKSAFDDIDGFDEDYFLYYEETDLCLRLRKAGYTIHYAENVPVCHIGSASERTTGTYALIRKRQAGLLLFFKKHYETHDIRRILKAMRKKAKRNQRRYRLLNLFFRKDKHQEEIEYNRAILDSIRDDLKTL